MICLIRTGALQDEEEDPPPSDHCDLGCGFLCYNLEGSEEFLSEEFCQASGDNCIPRVVGLGTCQLLNCAGSL